jgi:hypothetical protein
MALIPQTTCVHKIVSVRRIATRYPPTFYPLPIPHYQLPNAAINMKYSFEDYNEYNVLKIPLTLVLVNFYLLKQVLIFVLPLISSVPFLLKFAHEQFSVALLFSSLPAALVIVGMLRRAPKTRSPIIRRIWRWGRFLLLSTLVLEIGFIILYIVLGIKKIDGVSLIFVYIDVVLIIFLAKSQRVRDVFAEFPNKQTSSEIPMS